jgi:glycosyltransferase involved in cell wall biosynthesis
MRHLRDSSSGAADGPTIELTIHGDHKPDSDAFHRRLAELARGTRTRFAGRFDNARIGLVHAELDVLVVPSTWYENSPLTIHEAFQHGTPVVTCDLGGMRETVRHEVDGLHFRAGDERGLAEALERLARDPALLERLARSVPAVKSIETDAEETEARYLRLLADASQSV